MVELLSTDLEEDDAVEIPVTRGEVEVDDCARTIERRPATVVIDLPPLTPLPPPPALQSDAPIALPRSQLGVWIALGATGAFVLSVIVALLVAMSTNHAQPRAPLAFEPPPPHEPVGPQIPPPAPVLDTADETATSIAPQTGTPQTAAPQAAAPQAAAPQTAAPQTEAQRRAPAVRATMNKASVAKPPVAPRASATKKGTVRTFRAASGKPIVVDGKRVGVAPAPIDVACGEHTIRVGDGKIERVRVPCDGSITVGNPD